ncbi:MAG: efflux RND transporter permease subunit, partial [Candidatus Xenobia bacterium]
MFLTRMALRNPVAVLMLCIVLVVLALNAIPRIPLDTLPKLTIPALQIITIYNGADPHTVEQSVTYPMEKAISAVSGISYIQSVSKEGISIVKAYFDWGTNLDSAEVEAIQHANSVLSQLPPNVSTPFVLKFDISNFPVCALAVQSKSLDERALYDIAFNNIEPSLEHVDGVSTAPVNGGRIRQINVYLDPNKLAAYHLTMQQVYNAVGNSNFLYPSGDIKVGNIDYRVYTETQFETVAPMNDVVVTTYNGMPVHVRDVGRVIDGAAVQTETVRINGEHGVMMFITKQPGQNTVMVVNHIKKALIGIQKRLNLTHPDIAFHIFFDQSVPIKDSIDSLVHESLSGALLAAIVILIFLRSFLSTGFVSLSMPLSALAAIFVLYLNGDTFNTFTLGGLTLAMGRLVDDAIVVIENIYRHLNQGEDRLTAALKGTEEVGLPVLASTITTVIVFLPIVFINGFPKFLFGPLAATVTYALFASYIASLTIIPVLARRWLVPEKVDVHAESPFDRFSARIHHFYEAISHGYASILRLAMRLRVLIVMAVLGLFVVTLGLVPHIGKELLPAQDENMFVVIGRAPIGQRIEETEKTVADAEQVIRQQLGDDITVIASDVGIPGTQRGTNAAAAAFSQNPGPHGFTIRVNLKPAGERTRSVYDDINIVRPTLVQRYPGVSIYLQPAGITNFLLNLGAQGAIDIQIQGFDLDRGFKLAQQVVDVINSTRGAADAQIKVENDYPEIKVAVNREKASLLGKMNG